MKEKGGSSIPTPIRPTNPLPITGTPSIAPATSTSSPRLPDWYAPPSSDTGRLPASQIPRERDVRLTLSGEGAIIPEAFGRCLIHRPRVFAVAQSGQSIVMGTLWCRGEITEVVGLYSGDEVFAGTATHYLGTAGQGVDPTLAAAIPGYGDTLAGYAYSVVTFTEEQLTVAQNLSAEVRGRKLYDPRTDTTVYTSNFAIMYRHIANAVGMEIDDDSIEAAANHCDEDVGGKVRWWGGLLFEQPRSIESQLQLLAEYAGCFHVRDGGRVKLIPDRPTATTASFSDRPEDVDAGAGMIVNGSVKLRKRALDQLPNQSIVEYTNPWGFPWRAGYAQTALPAGDIRPTTYRMVGFRNYNCAHRFSVEKQNRFNLVDLMVEFETFDEGLTTETGDVIELTHSIGLTDKKFRVTNVLEGGAPGRWIIHGEEYDPAVYSNSVKVEPTYPDISLPNPGDVPAGPTPALEEKLFVDEGGKTFSRFEIAFTGISWPFVGGYRVRVSAGGDVVMDNTVTHRGTTTHTTATPPVKQDLEYLVEVWAVNVFGKQGTTPGTATAIALGKLLKPTAPTNLQGYEFGQFVQLWWTDSIDIDLEGYRVKRIPEADYLTDVAGAWEHGNATVVSNRIDAARELLSAQPPGIYYYMVKSLDSLGQESVGFAARRIVVTVDGAGGVELQDLEHDTLVNMHVIERYGDARYAVTSEGRTWTDIFGAAGSTWTDGLAPGESWMDGENAASSLETDEWDIGSDKEANWFWSAAVETVGGTVTRSTLVAKAAAYPTFSTEGGDAFTGEARYFKAKIECTGAAGDGMVVKLPVTASFQGKPIDYVQEVSIPASPQPHSVTWDKNFTFAPKIEGITVIGSSFRVVAAENIDASGCDLRAWDSSDTAAAATVQISLKGT